MELSLSGRQHLNWAVFDIDYLGTMLEATPISDENTLVSLDSVNNASYDALSFKLREFVKYLSAEDRALIRVPDHAAYTSQVELLDKLARHVVHEQ